MTTPDPRGWWTGAETALSHAVQAAQHATPAVPSIDPTGGWAGRIESGLQLVVVVLALLVAYRVLGILCSLGRGLARAGGALAGAVARRRAGGGSR